MDTSRSSVLVAIGKWGGRVTAVLLLLFWGAFLIEHTSEWFLRAGGRFLPTRIWISQGFHGLMAVGLLLALRWERLGVALLLAGTIGFFAMIGELDMIPISLINLIPVVFFSIYWLALGKRTDSLTDHRP